MMIAVSAQPDGDTPKKTAPAVGAKTTTFPDTICYQMEECFTVAWKSRPWYLRILAALPWKLKNKSSAYDADLAEAERYARGTLPWLQSFGKCRNGQLTKDRRGR